MVDIWNQRAVTAGETMAKRLSMRPRTTKAIEAGLKAFETDLYMAFVDHNAPNPDVLAALAVTTARQRLQLLH